MRAADISCGAAKRRSHAAAGSGCFHFVGKAGVGLVVTPAAVVMTEELEPTFTPGQVIACTTCFDQELEGEVVAFDYDRRVLVVKRPSAKQSTNFDVHLVNLRCVSGCEIRKEAKSASQQPQRIIVEKVCFLSHCSAGLTRG